LSPPGIPQKTAQSFKRWCVNSHHLGCRLALFTWGLSFSQAKQQHVLSVSAQALDNKGANPAGNSSADNVLVAAAHQVVYKAAVQVATTNSVIQSLPVTTTQLSVQDVSAATLSAVAQAVDLVGPLSSEVDVMMTASSLLSNQAMVSPAPGNVPASGILPAIPVGMQH